MYFFLSLLFAAMVVFFYQMRKCVQNKHKKPDENLVDKDDSKNVERYFF